MAVPDAIPAAKAIFSLFLEFIHTLWLVMTSCVVASFRFFFPPPEKSVKGKVILITGGGEGIGRLMSRELAQRGASIVSWDVQEEWNLETRDLIQAEGGSFTPYTVDVRDRDSVFRMCERVRQEVGEVDILINNAGVVSGKRILQLTEEQVNRTFRVNVIAHFWTLQAFLPSMMSRNDGHIVTISSMAGHAGCVGLADYCASKFAAVGLHETVELELNAAGKLGVQTTLVCPAHVDTRLFRGFKQRFIPSLSPEYTSKRIVKAIVTNQKALCMPRIMYTTSILKHLLPVSACQPLMDLVGNRSAMAEFEGYEGNKLTQESTAH